MAAHEHIAAKEEGNGTSGAIAFDEAAKKVRQLAVKTWARLQRDVTSAELLAEYIEELNSVADAFFNNAAEAMSAAAPGKAPATAPCEPEMAAAA